MTGMVVSGRYTVTVPAGEYVLGDPCYAVPMDDWEPLLVSCNHFRDTSVGTVRGFQVLAFGTGGDGSYPGTDGVWYAVDAGMIGLVPMGLAEDAWSSWYGDRILQWEGLSKRVLFEAETRCTKRGRTLRFGDITIRVRS